MNGLTIYTFPVSSAFVIGKSVEEGLPKSGVGIDGRGLQDVGVVLGVAAGAVVVVMVTMGVFVTFGGR